jgi:hypothetical protein
MFIDDPMKDCKMISSEEQVESNNDNDKMEIDDEGNENESEKINENYIEISGVLFDEEKLLMDKDEISKYSDIKPMKFKQILRVKYTLCKQMLMNVLQNDFNDIKEINDNNSHNNNTHCYLVCDVIKMYLHENEIVLEWYSNGFSDFLANSLAMTITQLQLSPNGIMYKHYENSNEKCPLQNNTE